MELVHDGKTMLMISRRKTPAIGGLTEKQLQWCRSKWPWFERNSVQRLSDHERASAAYRIASLIEETRGTRETV